jgi:hypothetical protein
VNVYRKEDIEMNRKKIFLTEIAFITTLSFITVINLNQSFAASERVSIGGGSPGAIYYLFASSASRVVSKYNPELMVNSVSTGGSGQNAILVQKKEQEFGIVAQDVAYHAYKGIEEFKGKDCPDIRAVTGGYSYAMNLIVLDNSPIKSYRDIVGKKVCVGPVGGSYHIHVQRMMSLGYGIDISKELKLVHMSYDAAPDALKDGVVDAIFNPSGIIVETRGGGTFNLATLRKVRFISIEEDAITKITKVYPYFQKTLLKAGFFPNQNEDYRCLAVAALVAAHKDVREDIVYKFTKTIYEYKDELCQMMPGAKDFVDFSRIKSLTIPLHPGAIKYYQEKGVELPKF